MILNIFFKYFNKISPVIIQTPWVGAIGNCAEEIYFGLLRARREKKKVLFLFPKELFKPFIFSKGGLGINEELLKVESPYRFLSYHNPISQILCWMLTLTYCFFKVLNYLLGKIFNKVLEDSYLTPNIGQLELWYNSEKDLKASSEHYKWDEQINRPLDVDLPVKSRKKAFELRKEMGLPKDAWFVCIHVRESGYYGVEKEGMTKKIRNCDIKNYLKSIKYITEQGGWVVRMGDSSMKKLPKMEKVIDYPHSEFKSALMDIYFIKNCKYYIGSNSGIWDVAGLFQKPMVMPNLTPDLLAYPFRKGDLGCYKTIYSYQKKRSLTVQEIYGEYVDKGGNLFNTEKYDYRENTENEILELVNEFFQLQKNNKEQTALQKKCNGLHTIKRFKESGLFKQSDISFRYRVASRLDGYQGTMGQKYLEKNWSLSTE